MATFDNPVAFVKNSRFGDILVVQRNGQFWSVEYVRTTSAIRQSNGPADLSLAGEGGVLDAVADPRIVNNDNILISYAAVGDAGTKLIVKRGGFAPSQIVFESAEKPNPVRYGGRLAYVPDSTGATVVVIAVGDRGEPSLAQDINSVFGKTLRLSFDGHPIPPDNPYQGVAGARPEIWTIGHRDPFLARLEYPETAVIDREAGASGGDTLHFLQRGCNYGWPVPTALPQPLFVWTTPVRPTDMLRYDGTAFPELIDNLLVSAENYSGLIRVAFDGTNYREVGRIPLPAPIQRLTLGASGVLLALERGSTGRMIKIVPQ